MLTVYIPEYIPAHNKGEEALFLGIRKTLEGLNIGKIYLYSVDPIYDQRCYGPPVEVVTETIIPRSRQHKFKKLLQILKYIPGHLIYEMPSEILGRPSPKKYFHAASTKFTMRWTSFWPLMTMHMP